MKNLIRLFITKVTIALSIILLSTIALKANTIIKMQNVNGVYYLPCKINGLDMRFIYDTGASDVVMSLSEALFMIKNGYLKKEDITGTEYYKIANGEVEEGTTINIAEITIGNMVFRDVKGSIIHNLDAPLLLGQSLLERLGKIEFDYEDNTLTINSDENVVKRKKSEIAEKEHKKQQEPKMIIINARNRIEELMPVEQRKARTLKGRIIITEKKVKVRSSSNKRSKYSKVEGR